MHQSVIKTVAALSFALLALDSHANQGGGMKMDMGNMKVDSMEMDSSHGMRLAMNKAEVKAVHKDRRIPLRPIAVAPIH